MKKILLPITLIIYSINFAQITLAPSDFATGGDTVRMSQANDDGFDYISTGPGFVWDFSTLVPVSQSLKDFRSMVGAPAFLNFIFGTFAPLKYQASYFIESTAIPIDQLTSFLPVSIEDLFQFSRINADSVTSIGYSMIVDGNDVPFKSDTIEKRYDFPVDYGNSHFSRGYTKVDFNPMLDAKWNQHRTRTTTVDGHGIITTPFGVFNTLRIKHDITEIDSLYAVWPFVGGSWVAIPVPPSHEYEWWTNGEMEPILKITTSEVGGNETVTAIEYRDIYRGMDAGLEELAVEFSIFPNPVQNELNITTFEKIKSIRIVDMHGAIILEKLVNNETSVTIDVDQLSKGSYQIQVIAGSKTGFKTFIKR